MQPPAKSWPAGCASQGITEFDSKRLELLVRAAKTLADAKRIDTTTSLFKGREDKLALVGRRALVYKF